MTRWWVISLQLCFFGFVKELRPSEPFITPYLLSPWQNLTLDEVTQEIYPVATYSSLSLLVVVFLVTDFLRYKPVIVLEGISYVITYCLLIWARGVPSMQAVEFMYAMASSTEVAYYTYIYAKVDPKYYQRVTSHTYTAILVGRFLSGAFSQVVVSTKILNYWNLNIVTLSCECLALVIALTLPGVTRSIYFHRIEIETVPNGSCTEKSSLSSPQVTLTRRLFKAYAYLWTDFKAAYSDVDVCKWSFWWAVATCGCLQILNYIQPLWEEVASTRKEAEMYNGAIEALHTLLSALATFAIGLVHLNWEKFGNFTLMVASFVQGILLASMGLVRNIWVAYVNYMLFRIIYQMMLTVASAEVAKKINQDSHGLVFGINTFLALAFQTVLTAIIVDKLGLALPVTSQFVVYGGFHLVLGTIFFFVLFVACVRKSRLGSYSMTSSNMEAEVNKAVEL